MIATKVTAGLAESNGSLLPGLWRDSLHVTCGLTACTPGSAPGPTLGNEYGKTLPFFTYILTLSRGSICDSCYLSAWASTHRGKWGQLSSLTEIMDEKLKSENMQKTAVFYVYVIF